MIIIAILIPLDNSKFIFSLKTLFIGGSKTADIINIVKPATKDDETNALKPVNANITPKIQLKIKPRVIFLIFLTFLLIYFY